MEPYPITCVGRTDERYPSSLAAIADAPERLYVRGSFDALVGVHRLAVVGTRAMTSYGEQAVARFVRPVTARGVNIISGLALGVDALAHRTCLDAGGTTAAVLASGIDDDTIGPRTNLGLARDILSNGGALVSEYPPGTPAERWTFPARNRIISGLASAVLIIEAGLKSGALITARHAADQGCDVLAVPGSVFWSRSAGPNMLIQSGAKPVVSATDVLECFGLDDESGSETVSTRHPVHARIAAILNDGPASADTLAAAIEFDAARTLAELSLMEMNGLVCRCSDGTYRMS
jgi:DNA processing protein